MKTYKLLPALLIVSILAACSNGIEEGNATAPANTTVTPPTNTTTTQPIQQTAPATTQAGLNPAHGQPGHRCDISVGAPLNSPAGAGQSATPPPQQTIIKPTAPPPAVMPASTTTQAGMNPAHGQPGHRCDIAVGAPLNSKPTQ